MKYKCTNCGKTITISDSDFLRYREQLREIKNQCGFKYTPTVASVIENGLGCCDKTHINILK